MVSENLLLDFNAVKVELEKGEALFEAGDTPKYFYQVHSGKIKMCNFNDEGKEFIQGMFSVGESFGEPPLLINEQYPANAIALIDTIVYELPKEAFFKLLYANPEINLQLTISLAQRLFYKSVMASEISSQDAGHRIIKLLDYFKDTVYKVPPGQKYRVDLTRQEIADLTGLRVETVIRAIKELEKQKELTIESRKVYR